VGIFTRLKRSFEAEKQSYEALAVYAVCLLLVAVCVLAGLMIWVADFVGPIGSCFLFAVIFAIAAGIAKLIIDAKEREASRNFNIAKDTVTGEVAAVTAPFKAAVQSTTSGNLKPVVPVAIAAAIILLVLLSRDSDWS